MSTLSKRDAMHLVGEIRRAKVAGHAIAKRTGGGSDAAMAGFVGGLEIVLQHFLRLQGCYEAASALPAAMNDTPSQTDIDARNAEFARLSIKSTGNAA